MAWFGLPYNNIYAYDDVEEFYVFVIWAKTVGCNERETIRQAMQVVTMIESILPKPPLSYIINHELPPTWCK